MAPKKPPVKADSVRGDYGKCRDWWDVQHYAIAIKPDFATKTLRGKVVMDFRVLTEGRSRLQVDLQKPMELDSVFQQGKRVKFERYEQAYLLDVTSVPVGEETGLEMYFSGRPREAVMPPWDGGVIWSKDDLGNPWLSTACQGLGASAWWPVKDHGADEPDRGVNFSVTVPKGEVGVSNGRLTGTRNVGENTLYTWETKAPINTYNVCMNVGNYVSFNDTYNGMNGPLDLQFWFLEQHRDRAKSHLLDETKEMLKSFEYWFGPYPFYEDGYKLIETPFLGMEHQSGIAYGNGFMKGYMGADLSGSGWGTKWDYILVHESGHEWFGNHVSSKDVADMWIHEGFTTYSEVLFVESRYGKKAGNEYAIGLRTNIRNDIPIIGPYGVNREGSSDMYFKGVQLIHTYRCIVDDDEKFRDMLHQMNRRFGRKTVNTKDVEELMQEYTDVPLTGFFDTYLRTVKVPVLYLETVGNGEHRQLKAHFGDVTADFEMPVNIFINDKPFRVRIGTRPVTVAEGKYLGAAKTDIRVDPAYYLRMK